MKYRILILRKISLLLVLLAVLWLAGCVQDELVSSPPQVGSGIRFTLTVPDVGIPSVSSRTMTGTGVAKKEDEIKRVDILVFDASKTSAVFLEWAEGTGLAQDLAGDNSTVDFSAVLSPTTASTCVVVIANKDISTIVAGFKKGVTTKAEAMEAMLHSQEGKWAADGSTADGYMPIPMYGEKIVEKLGSPVNPITGISMKRMLARIDIRNSASDFTVEEVYLVNYNTTGYIAPAWNANGQLIDPVPDAPRIPDASGKKWGEWNAISYAVNGNTPYNGEIYAFEALAAEDAGGAAQDGDTGRKDAVCLIVKGKIGNGESTFYRIDFTKTGQTGEQVGYLPLKRNHRYIITVTEAAGVGYASIGEALASYTVMSNLKFRLIHYNRDKVKDVVYNGQYMLGVGEPEVNVSQYQDNSYAIDVFTDSPGGWKATVTEGSDWLTFEGGATVTSNVANDDTQLKLKIPYYNNGTTGTTRTATVTLTAGRLTHKIKVTQAVIDPGIIKFVDAYGNVLENGLFFPIRNPDGDDLPIEGQTVYVMFSVDKIAVRLSGTSNLGTIQYVANGLIPALDRTTVKSFTERVQAFTVKPNPRMMGDGTSASTSGWWWRWDGLIFNLYDKDNTRVGAELTFPINQGELQFSYRYNPTTANSRTYKVNLGAEQYMQLFTNSNWEIMKVESLNIVGDDGTGLLRANTDNDIIVGRKNADAKMYLQSVVDSDDDGNGNDIVGRGYDFRMKLPSGKWKEGKSGTIRITFRNVMHTTSDVEFPFYQTIDLQMVSETQSYTTAGNPYFYLYPLRFENRLFTSNSDRGYKTTIANAGKACSDIGDGWRLPTGRELLMSYVYMNALGGSAFNSSYEQGQNISGWYNNWSGGYASLSYYTDGSAGDFLTLDFSAGYKSSGTDYYFRCVRENSNSGTKYPYISERTSTGVTIVSRKNNVGVDSSVLFGLGETPDRSGAMNKVAPELQIENTSVSGKNWEGAKAACEAKGDGWRLPTQREMYLIISMGGSDISVNDQGFGYVVDWGSEFQKIVGMHWVLTERNAESLWLVGLDGNSKFDAYQSAGTATWPKYRCVRTVN